MSNNVLLLGAGFSADAGIPVLGNFMHAMWELARRQRTPSGDTLSGEDVSVLSDAMSIRDELDGYHGRAGFDDRNIEDILSMLSFNVLGGGKKEQEKLTKFTRAITRTIELSCAVTHPGIVRRNAAVVETGPASYRQFWKGLLNRYSDTRDFPTIITLNYDLVLERSLLQLLVGTTYGSHNAQAPVQSFSLDYAYKYVPEQSFLVQNVAYNGPDLRQIYGTNLAPNLSAPTALNIEVLKLHGSANFPRKQLPIEREFNVTESLYDSYILPPISNKFVSGAGDKVWRTALDRLRVAKNIVIVGYSLPQTDVYMQYFLKSAVGPNRDLNQITVIDPAVANLDSAVSGGIKDRYRSCFAAPLQERLLFNYGCQDTQSFINQLGDNPELLLL